MSEEQLDRAERMIGLGKFPLDMRCSYRIHNGQRLTSPGYLNYVIIFIFFINVINVSNY